MDRTLVVVRHAKSDWGVGVEDHDRPLNERGRRDASELGRWLRDNVGELGLVLCSTAARARQTWRLASPAFAQAPTARYEQRLYGAEVNALMSVVEEVDDGLGAVAVVGHNPGLSELVEALTGDAVELRTSSVAVVRWAGAWADVWSRSGHLAAQATPRG